MEVFKFKKFPHKVIYKGDVYTHRVGGNKNILVEVEDKEGGHIQFIFQNELINKMNFIS